MSRRAIFGSVVGSLALIGANFHNALANVSLKNGNFFVGYTDIIYQGGIEEGWQRVFNSKTPYKGILGWGWGNEYEVYLTVSADGSVVVHEYGGGAENRFTPVTFNVAELNKSVDDIGAVAQKLGALGSTSQLDAYKKHLRSDATFRNDEWEKFRTQGKIAARKLKSGSQLKSNRFSYQYLTKVDDGYIRNFDTGKVERFDELGKLVKISDKNKNFVTFTYGKDGHLQKLVDNFNRKMFFSFNNKGLLSKIEGENSKTVTYTYFPTDELKESVDVDGNRYAYKYDTKGRHNMAEIAYSDRTTMSISYWDRDKHENVKSVKDRDGTITEYSYKSDSSDSGHTSVAVKVKSAEGKAISSSEYEYFVKYKPDGEEWTQKLVTVLDGDKTETTYNEAFGLPVTIKHGTEETVFEYDVKGHVTKKTTPTEITSLHYDPSAGKVDRVERASRLDVKDKSWSMFKYDAKANLVFARNSEGKEVELLYDTNGRIHDLVDKKEKHRITFKYNENSKPIAITDPALGTINVSYTNSGDIKKVESTAGRKIALQVTSAFQNLLEIIRPAGVTLSL